MAFFPVLKAVNGVTNKVSLSHMYKQEDVIKERTICLNQIFRILLLLEVGQLSITKLTLPRET